LGGTGEKGVMGTGIFGCGGFGGKKVMRWFLGWGFLGQGGTFLAVFLSFASIELTMTEYEIND
jgi:hypothetical protein